MAEAEEHVLGVPPRARSRGAQGAAGRQHDRHRPGVPGPADADSGEHVHYRNVDVSSIKELVRRWYPRAYYSAPAKTGNHRALADVQESIEELRYYRDAVFVPLPGPDSATAKQIAARHEAALTGAAAPTTDAPLSGRVTSSAEPGDPLSASRCGPVTGWRSYPR